LRVPTPPPAAPSCLGLALALTLAGCAAAKSPRVSWPPPPATERIRLVRTLSGGDDVEGRLTRFWRRVAGEEQPPRLFHPLGVAVAPAGDFLAVSDQGLGQVMLFDLAGGRLRILGRDELGELPAGVAVEGALVWVVVPQRKAALAFSREGKLQRAIDLPDCERPFGLAIDAAQGLLYVSDASSPQGDGHVIHVHGLADGEHRQRLGQKGHGPGQLFFPTFLALGPGGALYVADTMNARVLELDAGGGLVRQFGERGDRFGQFDKPKGVALDGFGNLYVVDSFFAAVQIFNREGSLLLFFGGPGDSPGFLANPAGIAIDAQNRIYVANGLNHRVEVYELVNTAGPDSRAGLAP
jgi:sugar lactone lactonase YvrE